MASQPTDSQSNALPLGYSHDKSIEWPGDDEAGAHTLYEDSRDSWSVFIPLSAESMSVEPGDSASVASSLKVPSLRLIRLPEHITKPVLPRAQKLAIIDGYMEVEIGRDLPPAGSDKPRIRLKDMEVSKLHATIYWDITRHEWAIVDMGSKHGTFVLSHAGSVTPTPGSANEDQKGQRLSLPRTSSVPRQLRHLDRLFVGSTTFLIHIHDDCLPCSDCTSGGGDEIPLSSTQQSATGFSASNKRKRDSALEPPSVSSSNPKEALSVLKRSLLSRHGGSSSSGKGSYVDRSARRRALHPDTTPGVPQEQGTVGIRLTSPSLPTPPPEPPRPPSPPAPLTSSNIGHRLLMKQGWTPGTALRAPSSTTDDAVSSIDLVSPLEPKARASRAGLGSTDSSLVPPQYGQGTSWREEGKYRRWANNASAH